MEQVSAGVSTGVGLPLAHWADEATGATKDVEAVQARRHVGEDAEEATARAVIAGGTPHPRLLRRKEELGEMPVGRIEQATE